MLAGKVREAIKKHRLISRGDRILVASSGGPDSTALLCILNSLKKELKVSLHVAHLDHKLRAGSYKDRVFIESLAQELGLPVTCAQINIRALAKKGSLEEVARNARLGFLFDTAKKIKADKIALGHNLDDQAETVLMRILRGTGLNGLAGILPKRNIAGYEIIRPLLGIRRSEIENYLKEKKIRSRRDPSNAQDIYFRNKIRNRLIPLLEREYNLNIRQVLSNLGEAAGYDYEYLERSALRLTGKTGTKVSLNKLKNLHPAIRRLLLRLYIARIKGDNRRIGFRHMEELEDLVFNRPDNSVVDLPKGVSALKNKDYFIMYSKNEAPGGLKPPGRSL